jgi:hypothetical protein
MSIPKERSNAERRLLYDTEERWTNANLWKVLVTVHRATVILSAAKDLAMNYGPGDPSLRSG